MLPRPRTLDCREEEYTDETPSHSAVSLVERAPLAQQFPGPVDADIDLVTARRAAGGLTQMLSEAQRTKNRSELQDLSAAACDALRHRRPREYTSARAADLPRINSVTPGFP